MSTSTATETRASIGAKIAIPDPTPGVLPAALTAEPLPERPTGPVEVSHQPVSIGAVPTPPPEPETLVHPKGNIIRTLSTEPLRASPVPPSVTFGPPTKIETTGNGIVRETY